MSERKIVAQELTTLFSCLSNPDRIRIIEELSHGEKDVKTLSTSLDISQSSTSQHLSKLKSLRLVEERKENKHRFYHLVAPILAEWVLEGLKYSELYLVGSSDFNKLIKKAKKKWSC